MTTEDGSDFAVALAREIAKQLPIKEASQPAAEEVGDLLSDLVATLRLITFPLQLGAVGQRRFRRFIDRSADKVPLERRVEPAMQIAGPVFEAIRFVPEGSIGDDAFAELLARAFDRERAGQAHPAFPSILRSLADDELEILRHLRSTPIAIFIGTQVGNDLTAPPQDHKRPELDFCVHTDLAVIYANHIEALGLINTLIAFSTDDGFVSPQHLYWTLELSDFGRLFTRAVFS